MAKKAKNVAISKAPTKGVSSLSIPKYSYSGENMYLSTSWKLPKDVTSTKKNDRWEGILVRWIVDTMPIDDTGSEATPESKSANVANGRVQSIGRTRYEYWTTYSASRTSSTIGPSNNDKGKKRYWNYLKRSKYYPYKYVTSVPSAISTSSNVLNVKDVFFYVNNWSTMTGYWAKQPNDARKKPQKGLAVDGFGVEVQPFNVKSSNSKAKTGFKKNKKGSYIKKGKKYIKIKNGTYTYKKKKYKVTAKDAKKRYNPYTKNGLVTYSRFAGGVPTSATFYDVLPPSAPTIKDFTIDNSHQHRIKTTISSNTGSGTRRLRRMTVYSIQLELGLYNSEYTAFESKTLILSDYNRKHFTATSKDFDLNPNALLDSKGQFADFIKRMKMVYSPVTPPAGANPKTLEYYIKDGNVYKLSEDETVKNGVQYYTATSTRSSLDVFDLVPNEYLNLTVYAYDAGLGGKSKTISKSYLFAYPYSVHLDKKIEEIGTRDTVDGKTVERPMFYQVHFSKETPSHGKRRNSTFTLQRLKNLEGERGWTEARWTSEASTSDSWSDVETSEADETTMVNSKSEAEPDTYKRTYFRVKSNSDDFPSFYSDPVVAPNYVTIPTASNEKCKFMEVTVEEDGTSLKIIYGFHVEVNEQDTKLSDGTEISWSPDKNAWNSNREPEAFDMPDKYYLSEEVMADWNTRIQNNDGTDLVATADSKYFNKDLPEDQLNDPSNVVDSMGMIYLRDLSEGTPYYLRIRRYLAEGLDEVDYAAKYTEYVNPAGGVSAVAPTSTPMKVILKGPEAVVVGRDFSVSWTYESISDSKQTEWKLCYGKPDADGNYYADKEKISYSLDDGGETVATMEKTSYLTVPVPIRFDDALKDIYHGDDSRGFVTVKYDDVKNFIVNDTLYLALTMKTTGEFATSPMLKVSYIQKPEAWFADDPSIDTEDEEEPETPQPIQKFTNDFVLRTQPLSLLIASDTKDCRIDARVYANSQNSQWNPDGLFVQPEGSGIAIVSDANATWNEVVGTETDAEGNVSEKTYYTTRITFLQNLEFLDAKQYRIELTLTHKDYDVNSDTIDPDTLVSMPLTRYFTVDWEHQALATNDSDPITITVNGQEKQVITAYAVPNGNPYSVSIYLSYPENYQEGDVCDVYRKTPDGMALICSGAEFGSVITDNYAPYSNTDVYKDALSYRLVTRTSDGDLDWTDIQYYLYGYVMRFDWGSEETSTARPYNYVDLPYNLSYKDSFTKQFDSRLHLDGKFRGYWNEGIERSSSLSTDIIRVTDWETKERIRALAHYSGPVFVRLPDGCAYEANVDVTDIPNNYSSDIMTVSFDVKEIALSERFMAN